MEALTIWLTILAWLAGDGARPGPPATTGDRQAAPPAADAPAQAVTSSDITEDATADRADAAASAPSAASGLRVRVHADGIPSAEPGAEPRRVTQIITLAADGKRVRLDQLGEPRKEGEDGALEKRILVHLGDEPATYELAPDLKTYRKELGDLDNLQRERDIWEGEFRRKVGRLAADQREALLDENHIRADGARKVDIEFGPGETMLGHETQRIRVRENDRMIVDAFIADRIEGGASFFDLYRRLGAFSEDVLKVLQHVPGLPLGGEITVVAKLSVHTFRFGVESIERIPTDRATFAVPEGAEEVAPPPARIACESCGKVMDRARMIRFNDRGTLHHVCSRDCRKELFERLLKGRLKKTE